jgi:hypothetical protein
MRRLVMTLLVAVLLGVGGSPAVVAQSPSPGPVGVGGRVELPEYGFALTFPEDWAWVRYSSEDSDSVIAQLVDITSPEFVAQNEVVFEEVDAEMPLVGRAASRGGSCSVTVLPTDLTIDAIASNYVTWIEGQPDSFPDGAMVTDVALPAIEAKRIDMSYTEEGWQKPMPTSYYLFTRGSRGYVLACMADDPPDDRWLSIADMFEFLPAEE